MTWLRALQHPQGLVDVKAPGITKNITTSSRSCDTLCDFPGNNHRGLRILILIKTILNGHTQPNLERLKVTWPSQLAGRLRLDYSPIVQCDL